MAECFALCRCASVGGCAFGIQSADVTYTDAMRVMPLAMCSGDGERSACFDSAVHKNEVMVADVIEAALCMPAANVIDVEMPHCLSCCTVDDDGINPSHFVSGLDL